jgi:hypothetical protein
MCLLSFSARIGSQNQQTQSKIQEISWVGTHAFLAKIPWWVGYPRKNPKKYAKIQKLPWRGYHAKKSKKYHGGGIMLKNPKNTMDGVSCYIIQKNTMEGVSC